MKIYVINLKRSEDRRKHIDRIFGAFGVDYEFFQAIDGSLGEHRAFKNYSRESCLKAWRRPLTDSEVGCFASHYLLWQRCVATAEPMIVTEDDIDLLPRFMEAVTMLPSLAEFGYLRLAGLVEKPATKVAHQLPSDWKLMRFLAGPLGSQAYALFPAAASRFLAGAATWTLPVDDYMDAFWEHGVDALALIPFVVSHHEQELESTIWRGKSPSTLMRGQVWRPKRFLARKLGDARRHVANLQYRLGARTIRTER